MFPFCLLCSREGLAAPSRHPSSSLLSELRVCVWWVGGGSGPRGLCLLCRLLWVDAGLFCILVETS